MNKREWQKFFELMQKITDLPDKTWGQKKDAVEQAADECEAATCLEEFINWWGF